MVLDNIKYGADIVMLGPLLKRKFDISIDGSSRFTYLDNEIFMAFVKIVSSFSPYSLLCSLSRLQHRRRRIAGCSIMSWRPFSSNKIPNR